MPSPSAAARGERWGRKEEQLTGDEEQAGRKLLQEHDAFPPKVAGKKDEHGSRGNRRPELRDLHARAGEEIKVSKQGEQGRLLDRRNLIDI